VARTQIQDLQTAARSYAAKNSAKGKHRRENWWRRWLPFRKAI